MASVFSFQFSSEICYVTYVEVMEYTLMSVDIWFISFHNELTISMILSLHVLIKPWNLISIHFHISSMTMSF